LGLRATADSFGGPSFLGLENAAAMNNQLRTGADKGKNF